MATLDDLKSAANALRKAATSLRAQNSQLIRDADNHRNLTERQISQLNETVRLREQEETRTNNPDQVNALKDQEQMLKTQIQAKIGERDSEDQRVKDLIAQNEERATKYEQQAAEIEGDISAI